jgi:D-amino-acid dehydrogenase
MSERRSDVVVIGGGIVGLSSAWYLRKAGLEVTLICRDPLGVGTSAGNAGMIVPSHVIPLAAPGVISQGLRWLLNPASPFHIKARLDPDLIRWLLTFRSHCTDRHVAYAAPILAELSLRSVRHFEELQAEVGEFGWRQTGLLMVHRSAKYRDDDWRAADVAEGLGLRVRRLDEAGTRAAEPGIRSDVLGSVLYQDDGRVDPDAFLRVMGTALREAGVRIEEGAEVTGLSASTGSVRMATRQGSIVADTVVLATGSWSAALGRMLGSRLPVQPAKGYSITIPRRDGMPTIPMILAEDKVTVTPMPDRLRFAGTLALGDFDPSIDPRRFGPIQSQALKYQPDISRDQVDVSRAWSGFRPASPDGLPIIGRIVRSPRVVAATGHGMMGVTLGPVTGRLVADLVAGNDPVVNPEPFAPSRF